MLVRGAGILHAGRTGEHHRQDHRLVDGIDVHAGDLRDHLVDAHAGRPFAQIADQIVMGFHNGNRKTHLGFQLAQPGHVDLDDLDAGAAQAIERSRRDRRGVGVEIGEEPVPVDPQAHPSR